MLAVARTFAVVGVEAVPVDAEVDIHRGLPAFNVVGLPDAAVRESRERVRAAIVNSGLDFPLKRITVSLAPAELRKAGPGFDLAIAAGILVASGQMPARLLAEWALAGELALDGRLRAVRGALAMAEAAARVGSHGIALPEAGAAEASLIEDLTIAPLRALADLGGLSRGELEAVPPPSEPPAGTGLTGGSPGAPDMSELRGQPALRSAVEIAAAGGHSLLMIGPPGAGKSMAARRLPSIMPDLCRSERIEVMRVAGVAGKGTGHGGARPFRAPHHTISPAGLVGGGTPPRPGEISLAHRGVLFLDELAEFQRPSLEALRQPLEEGAVTIGRAAGALRFPAQFQLVAAANPCPCGHGEDSSSCSCTPEAVRRYETRLSGALADRIDITLRISQPSAAALGGDPGESSELIRERVRGARRCQEERLGPGRTNAELEEGELRERSAIDAAAVATLERGKERHRLSGRGYSRVLRIARTVADLDGSEAIGEGHVEQALALRRRGSG
jgi:magnesium chelatase family protein